MKSIYEIGDRVSFMSRNQCTLNGNYIDGVIKHYIGYIKQVRRSLFGRTCYAVCVAKTNNIIIVSERDIFGKVEKKETPNECPNTRV